MNTQSTEVHEQAKRVTTQADQPRKHMRTSST